MLISQTQLDLLEKQSRGGILSTLNTFFRLTSQNSEADRHNDKVQKEISEARTSLEKKLAEGEHIWKQAKK
jgi:hypothetical protein